MAGALCTVVVLGLHCLHLRSALRGERSPHGCVTLAVMVAVAVVGQVLVGYFWTWTWALVATSAILVLPAKGGFAVFAAVVAGAYLVAGHEEVALRREVARRSARAGSSWPGRTRR